jgi:dienelactone hydrolase
MQHRSDNFKKLKLFSLAISFTASLWAGQTTVLFQPTSLAVGPFPSNALTLRDGDQATGVRVSLPSSADNCDSSVSRSVCSNSTLLNQLDGFSVNPRLMVCFSATVDANTLQAGIHFVPTAGGSEVSINQIIVDPASNCAFAKPNQVLNQDTQYLLAVTDAVHDSQGQKVKEDEAFADCMKSGEAYCEQLNVALQQMLQQPAWAGKIVAASLFTTMSATSWQEKARKFVDATELPLVLPAGYPWSFSLSDVKSITWTPAQSGLPVQDIPLSALAGVAKIEFGFYLSPNFLSTQTGTIAVTPTEDPISSPVPVPGFPLGFLPVSFHVFLPAGPPPKAGFPLVIYGHGLGDNQFGAPTFIASTLAKNGFATLAMEIIGHGYGAGSVVNVADSQGQHQIATPGRGILLPGNSIIGATDGCVAPGAIAVRDCGRQTAVDLVALVDTIQRTKGLGIGIDPNRLYFVGQSFGATYGTLFHAVEPGVKVAVMSAGGGTSADIARLAVPARPLGIEYLAGLGLLNVPPAAPEAYFHDNFNDNYVLRDNPPVLNNVPGAMPIQAAFEAADWLGMLGDPLSFAPHLKSYPLNGVPAKSTLFLFSKGDLEVPNPTNSALIRAADGQSWSWYFRFDIAASLHPELLSIGEPGPRLPHAILSYPTVFDYPAETSISLAEQQQVASYFASNGTSNPDPNLFVTAPFSPELHLFEMPTVLPEQLNFIQIAP